MGSTADYIALRTALERYERAERVAKLLKATFADDVADAAYLAMTRIAIRCGHDLGSRTETVIDFAIRRVRAFNNTIGKAA